MNHIITNSDVKQKAQRYTTVFYEAMNDDQIRNDDDAFHFLTWTGSVFSANAT